LFNARLRAELKKLRSHRTLWSCVLVLLFIPVFWLTMAFPCLEAHSQFRPVFLMVCVLGLVRLRQRGSLADQYPPRLLFADDRHNIFLDALAHTRRCSRPYSSHSSASSPSSICFHKWRSL